MATERGMQGKKDENQRQWEHADFPILCEGCLGETPYVRMEKHPHGGTCKMCDRPFTLFRWRPGRGEGFKKTEVCQVCSKVKNLCQTCILDLQFGLPSQIRDAVLAQEDGALAAPESDVNREYHSSQHLALLAEGRDPWENENNPNEQLIQLARNAQTDRGSTRVKIHKAPTPQKVNSHREEREEGRSKSVVTDGPWLQPESSIGSASNSTISSDVLKGYGRILSVNDDITSHQLEECVCSVDKDDQAPSSKKRKEPTAPAPEKQHNGSQGSTRSKKIGAGLTARGQPPPPGPPPAWALAGHSKPPSQQ